MRPALLAAAALVLAGCGGASHQPVVGAGAKAVPPNTVVFFAARVDDPRWRELARAVLHFVPRVPANAAEVDVAVLQGGTRVVLTDASPARRGAASLADDPHYRDLLRNLPHGVHAYAYVRGDLAGDRLLRIPGQIGTTVANFRVKFRVVAHPGTQVSNALLRWRWGGAWLTKHGIGARVRSAGPALATSQRVRTIQILAQPYAPALLDEIPADATSVSDVVVPQSMFELLRRQPVALRRLFPRSGFDLPTDLDAILAGETALYRRPGGEITLVTSPPDAGAAGRALDRLLPQLHGVTVRRAFIGGQLVLSTSAAGIQAFRNGVAKLSADAAFRRAGIPPGVTAFVYRRGVLAAWARPDNGDATFTVHFLSGR